MARLHVQMWLLDDAGRRQLDVELEEPTRIDVERDPLFVYSRLEAVTERALQLAHDQALQLNRDTDRGRGVRP